MRIQILPRRQHALGGKFGLTIQEIAKAIGTCVDDLRKQALKLDFSRLAHNSPVVMSPDVVLGTVAAMALVQSYDHANGYLFQLVIAHNLIETWTSLKDVRDAIATIENGKCANPTERENQDAKLGEQRMKLLKTTERLLEALGHKLEADLRAGRRRVRGSYRPRRRRRRGRVTGAQDSTQHVMSILALVRTIGTAIGAEVKRNGVRPGMFAAIFDSPAFHEQLRTAFDNVKLNSLELASLDFAESFDIGSEALDTVRDIVAALKAAWAP